jgi:hypothetical protein
MHSFCLDQSQIPLKSIHHLIFSYWAFLIIFGIYKKGLLLILNNHNRKLKSFILENHSIQQIYMLLQVILSLDLSHKYPKIIIYHQISKWLKITLLINLLLNEIFWMVFSVQYGVCQEITFFFIFKISSLKLF